MSSGICFFNKRRTNTFFDIETHHGVSGIQKKEPPMTTTALSFEDFLRQFCFNLNLARHISAERECFVTDLEGKIVPQAARVLAHLAMRYPDLIANFSYELSACQIEFKSGPCKNATELVQKLGELETALDNTLCDLGLSKRWIEVAPADMPLNVYPDPEGRYQRLAEAMSEEVLLAACRITGTHFHIGMPDANTALRVYNQLLPHVAHLTTLGDNSNGERLALYRVVAPNCDPVAYASWENFYTHALAQGFADNPRNCWDGVRLTARGTVEVRVFGVSKDLAQLAQWADEVHKLCWEEN